jgi:uncharacterized protein DUF3352
MNRKTRYFVIASLLVLGIGVAAGMIAYYVGVPTAFAQQGPDELQLVPGEALVVAYANVHEVMVSNLRERVRQAMPQLPDGQREFEEATGINIESDVDRVVAALVPPVDGRLDVPRSGLIIAAGRFDQVKIESLMREHGAAEETYKGRRMFAAQDGGATMSLAFIDPGLVAVGSSTLVRGAIDRKDGGLSVRTNDEIMTLVRSLDRGNVWAVGRFDALAAQANLPSQVVNQLPPITWFAISGHVNGGLLGDVRMQTRDEESANQFRDVIRGVIALGKLQADTHPELEPVLRSIQLGGSGTTVAVSFELPADTIDRLARPGVLEPGR